MDTDDALLADLDESQRRAVTHPASLLAISAPAGSGKTRVLTRRIAWLASTGVQRRERMLAVTFTRKAAGELRARLATPGGPGAVTAGTFHSLALAQLRRRATERDREFPTLLDRKARLIAPMVRSRGAQATVEINEIAAEIEWAKARMIAPGEYVAAVERLQRRVPRPAEQLAAHYERYELEKRRRRLVDFDDLITGAARVLRDDEDFAASFRFRFRSFFVDEFQDVTLAQLQLLKAWLGQNRALTVVGDAAQSIYAFAGAEPDVLDRFGAYFPGAEHVALVTNYRSSAPIVAVSNAVLTAASGVSRPPPRAVIEGGPLPVMRATRDEDDEASVVARALREAHGRGVPWRACAVLYRINAQSERFERALHDAGIPFRLRGAKAFLARPEVKALLDKLRAVDRRERRPFTEHVTDLDALARQDDGTDEEGVDDAMREHASALARLGREYVESEGGMGSLPGFVTWLEGATRGDDPLGHLHDAVELCTFHAAKGLEWHLVCVTGLEAGLVPISHARTAAQRAEEHRLLHVALSRAEQELLLTWAEQRGKPRKPSPFLRPVEDALADLRGPRPLDGAARRERLGTTRAALRASRDDDVPDTDRALLEALKDWRRGLARAHAIPPYVVFNDRTLIEIARERPTTTAELLDVNGVGPAKLDRYGDAVLGLVREHVAPRAAQ